MRSYLFIFVVVAFISSEISAQNIQLPAPQKTGGTSLLEALSKRHTSRSFDERDISFQQISNLLWAAFGINREDGKRTAPSIMNFQEIDLYVLLKNGIFRYVAQENQLVFISNEDIRFMSGQQDQIKEAPLHIIMVANFDRMGKGITFDKMSLSYIDAGHISQNIYLYAASAGLDAGARHWINKEIITPKLGLGISQFIVIAHCVGYPRPVN